MRSPLSFDSIANHCWRFFGRLCANCKHVLPISVISGKICMYLIQSSGAKMRPMAQISRITGLVFRIFSVTRMLFSVWTQYRPSAPSSRHSDTSKRRSQAGAPGARIHYTAGRGQNRADTSCVMFLAENWKPLLSASIAFDRSNILGLSPNPYTSRKEQA